MSSDDQKAKRGKFGMMGLAVMGRNLALNVEDHGFPVSVWNREPDKVDAFMSEFQSKQFIGTKSLEEFVQSLERPRRLMMLIKAGPPVDQMMDRLKRPLAPGVI